MDTLISLKELGENTMCFYDYTNNKDVLFEEVEELRNELGIHNINILKEELKKKAIDFHGKECESSEMLVVSSQIDLLKEIFNIEEEELE